MSTNKSTWGNGPWQTEPDEGRFHHAGLACLIKRGPNSGAWCGYVAIPPGHPWHGEHYDSVDCDVHGGLTYGQKCSEHICHVTKPGESDDVWWLGFDCAHGGDVAPGYSRALSMFAMFGDGDSIGGGSAYRTIDYVTAETKKLAEQAAVARVTA